jgi:hypothetical protein
MLNADPDLASYNNACIHAEPGPQTWSVASNRRKDTWYWIKINAIGIYYKYLYVIY